MENYIWVTKIAENNSSKQYRIKESDFDPTIFAKYDKEAEKKKREERYNSPEAVEHRKLVEKSRKEIDPIAFMAYGSGPSRNELKEKANASLMHKGKLDEGAIGNLMDIGLTDAKERNKQREKTMGHGLRKMKTGKLIPRKKKH